LIPNIYDTDYGYHATAQKQTVEILAVRAESIFGSFSYRKTIEQCMLFNLYFAKLAMLAHYPRASPIERLSFTSAPSHSHFPRLKNGKNSLNVITIQIDFLFYSDYIAFIYVYTRAFGF
jgi:hypothetical protein